jgi:hypothetical protein
MHIEKIVTSVGQGLEKPRFGLQNGVATWKTV